MVELFINSLINILCSRKYVLLLKDKKAGQKGQMGLTLYWGFEAMLQMTNEYLDFILLQYRRFCVDVHVWQF